MQEIESWTAKERETTHTAEEVQEIDNWPAVGEQNILTAEEVQYIESWLEERKKQAIAAKKGGMSNAEILRRAGWQDLLEGTLSATAFRNFL